MVKHMAQVSNKPGPWSTVATAPDQGGQPASHFSWAPNPDIQSEVTDTAVEACTPTPAPAPPQLIPETAGQCPQALATPGTHAEGSAPIASRLLDPKWFPWGQGSPYIQNGV